MSHTLRLLVLATLALCACTSKNPGYMEAADMASIQDGPRLDLAMPPDLASPPNDSGCACGPGMVCLSGSCVAGCNIGGTVYPLGASNPSNACQSCQPARSTEAFSNVSNGIGCGASLVCLDGTCQSNAGCDILGTHYSTGAANPSAACQSCQPAKSTSSWSATADGDMCASGAVCASGSCAAECFIGGALYTAGAARPSFPCQICQPNASTSAWSNLVDGATCGTNQVCSAGACVAAPSCVIGGVTYAPGTAQPGNVCASCQPTKSTTNWSPVLDGTSCDTGKICLGGTCSVPSGSCMIDGMSVGAGTIDPGNLCLSCQPGKSTTQWSAVTDGTDCGGYGDLCISGTCTTGCNIDGHYYTNGYVNPTNACEVCYWYYPNVWSTQYDGTSCGTNKVCNGGECYDGCTIGGVKYALGAVNPSDACQVCDPSYDPTAWSALDDGSACGGGNVCHSGTCYDGCTVSGVKYAIGASSPGNVCMTCQPDVSPTAFSPAPSGGTCGPKSFCDGGNCVNGCYIGGYVWAAGDQLYDCTECDPDVSTTLATPSADGATCYGHYFVGVCVAQQCSIGCWIGGTFYDDGAINSANPCQECDYYLSSTGWSNVTSGTSCGTGKTCSAGTCN